MKGLLAFYTFIILSFSGINGFSQNTIWDGDFQKDYAFYEGFNYTGLDQLKKQWIIGNCHGNRSRPVGYEDQYYHNDNLELDGSMLKIRVDKRKGWGYLKNKTENLDNDKYWEDYSRKAPDKNANWRLYRYTSGRITSRAEFLYGKFVAWCKIPNSKENGAAFFPAFWLMSCDKTPDSEIDIFEFTWRGPETVYYSYHQYTKPRFESVYMDTEHIDVDYSLDFHEFALYWYPDSLIWCVDDIAYRKIYANDGGFPHEACHINFNLAYVSQWAKDTRVRTNFSRTFEIDSVQVFSLKSGYNSSGFNAIGPDDFFELADDRDAPFPSDYFPGNFSPQGYVPEE